jgi:hypothetical protein
MDAGTCHEEVDFDGLAYSIPESMIPRAEGRPLRACDSAGAAACPKAAEAVQAAMKVREGCAWHGTDI